MNPSPSGGTTASVRTLDVVSPYDGTVILTVPDADRKSVDQAVAAARAAQGEWARTPTVKRGAMMHAAAALVREEQDALARLISTEMGKPIGQARSEAASVAELIDYFAEEGQRVVGEVPKLDLANELPMVVKEPVGVVAAITPFNYPIGLLSWKLGPALACGCSVVAKPTEYAPSAAIRLCELFLAAGLPEGVFQVLTGGPETGKELVRHPSVDKVAFTGGLVAGRAVGSEAVAHDKRVSLELGGQCPALVMSGADLDTAIPALVKHTFNNSGQYCYRVNRIYVEEPLRSEFSDRFVEAAARLTISDPLEEGCDVGPLCHDGILERSVAHVADATANGARVLLGGGSVEVDGNGSGRFMAPTVIDDCRQEMAVMQEETFGPVVGIMGVESLAEAVVHANDSIYGLAAYVFTADSGLGLQAALALRAGSIWVNDVKKAYPQLPFGGYKASGLGREKSHFGLDEYLELKTVYLALPEL
jgi:succinate-semialdehyde dehydrogenase / glutarate-semialdehyde dehydrogenase